MVEHNLKRMTEARTLVVEMLPSIAQEDKGESLRFFVAAGTFVDMGKLNIALQALKDGSSNDGVRLALEGPLVATGAYIAMAHMNAKLVGIAPRSAFDGVFGPEPR